jgi:uncharacterized membrane protein YqaE (UPF0057 family)
MLYLIALIVPPLAVLLAGKPFQSLINLIIWIPTLHIGAVIHAWMVVSNHYADVRQKRLVRDMTKAQLAAQGVAEGLRQRQP